MDFQLVLIDVATGATNTPSYATNGAQTPDWSPDGRKVVYRRLYYTTAPPMPLDSAGIHILDLSTGQDQPVKSNGQVVFGEPRWSRDGTWIAFLTFIEGGTRMAIGLVHPDGSGLRTLLAADPSSDLRNLVWFRPPGSTSDGLLYQEATFRSSIGFISPDGRPPTRYPFLYWYSDVSPDGTEYTVLRNQPSDSTSVVFTLRVNDFTGETLRQVSYFAPPSIPGQALKGSSSSGAVR
jgi:Tol biopolymer transport system component